MNKKKPLIFVHRAWQEWYPNGDEELLDIDYVELDVRKTADNILVVSHYRSLKNTIRRVLVDKNSYLDLFKKTGKKLPKLDDVVGDLNGQVGFNLDLKQEGILAEVGKLVARHKIEKRVIIDSCYCSDLEKLAEQLPRAQFAYSYNYKDKKGLESFRIIKAIGYFSYFALYPLWPQIVKFLTNRAPFVPGASIYWRVANQGVVEFFHSRNIPVYVWPVNREKDMRKMIELGIDGIKTSKPEVLNKVLNPKLKIQSKFKAQNLKSKTAV